MNTISVALVTACFYRRRGWLAFIPALLVAWSRIYTGSHWPTDIVISLLLGLGSTLLLLCSLEWLWRRLGARALPAIHKAHPSLLSA
jgi:undecaprenyl-diphosphatase